MGFRIPATTATPLIRCDFTDQAAWLRLVELVTSPQGDFQAYVQAVDDERLDGLSAADAAAAAPAEHSFLLLADAEALFGPEHAVTVVEVGTARQFRVIPAQAWSVENNLSIANLDFADFLANADPDGVFRGFPE
jgi:hypothetical protein